MAFQEAVDYALDPNVVNPILDERYANLLAEGIAVMESPASIQNWIANRRIYLQSILPNPTFGISGPTSFSTSLNNAVLSGTAPLQIDGILINGIEYPILWTSTTAWQITVPLSVGLNNLAIAGIDRFGNPVSGANATASSAATSTRPRSA